MAPAPVVRMNGHVASGLFRWKVTVVGSTTSTSLPVTLPASSYSDPSRLAGPFGWLIRLTRSKDAFTSSPVRSEPSLNVRPSRSVHVYVLGLSNLHDSASAGSGLFPPGAIVISPYMTL